MYTKDPYATMPHEGPCVVMRDGEPISPVLDTPDDAFYWLQRHQGQSIAYCLTYGGYRVVKA
jgi:hypothetical protein